MVVAPQGCHEGSNAPPLRSPVVDKERKDEDSKRFSLIGRRGVQCTEFCSVLWYCCLGDRKHIQ